MRVRRWLPTVGVAAVVTALAWAGLGAGLFHSFRLRASDALFPVGTADPRIVVVGIDGRSLEAVGRRWPWPRSLQADLIARIWDGRPALVAVDVVYSPAVPDDPQLADSLSRGPVGRRLLGRPGAGRPKAAHHPLADRTGGPIGRRRCGGGRSQHHPRPR